MFAPAANPTANPAARPPGREHWPVYPAHFYGLRVTQLVFAVITVGLDAYVLYLLSFPGASLNMFTAVVTIIVCVYLLVAEFALPSIYNYWAVLGLDMLLVVFWLVSFALMASDAAPMVKATGYYRGSNTFASLADCMAAVAAVGGVEFALFLAALVVTGLALHRHRALGLHCMPGQARLVGPDAAEKCVAAPTFESGPSAPQVIPSWAVPPGQSVPRPVQPVPRPAESLPDPVQPAPVPVQPIFYHEVQA